MGKFEDMLKSLGYNEYRTIEKFSPAGKAFFMDNEDLKGVYWYYESTDFIIDIHDFFIKKERLLDSFADMKPYMAFISSYILSGNGEWLSPYQNLSSNTMFVVNVEKHSIRFVLHANCPYFAVSINFKNSMIEKYVLDKLKISKDEVVNIFLNTRELAKNQIKDIANEIINCNMNLPSADIFFEAKAKEWLSITIDKYIKQKNIKSISVSDEKAIENVANYINDHYVLSIPQELLEKISMMSKTKLKTIFKQKYHMSITQYIQRKRINIAENLLLTTSLEIKDIAKSVGYNSHSRFSELYKKYKGVYPKDVRK